MEHSVSDISNEDKTTESSLPKTIAEPRVISPGSNAGAGAKREIWQSHGFLFNEKNRDDRDRQLSVELNMEASILAEDVIRAGGFGAKDDISSFLPVASDSTDFEESIRVARDYEEAQGEVHRPGLGWPKE
ncbi:PREDICTED: uncharacterized protein LOC104816402 [Tarenaya hassleriana]|uniref:uncharacterized protein LOC104816402 n=1 Tax=Tarenaya hassleriana TaxID=28532 RepID=UPI00053C8E42|nr:PREDICTED: uncharacterized protein LOC104816402 [Tarenaya hassleriana]